MDLRSLLVCFVFLILLCPLLEARISSFKCAARGEPWDSAFAHPVSGLWADMGSPGQWPSSSFPEDGNDLAVLSHSVPGLGSALASPPPHVGRASLCQNNILPWGKTTNRGFRTAWGLWPDHSKNNNVTYLL